MEPNKTIFPNYSGNNQLQNPLVTSTIPSAPAPMTPPQPPSQLPPVYDPSPKPLPHHHPAILIVAVLFLALIGGGYVYGNYVGLFSSPESALKKAFTSTITASSVHGEVTIPISYTLNSQAQEMTVKIVSDAEKTTSGDNPRVQGKITFNGQGLVVEADYKLVDKVVYFKIDQFPFAGLASGAEVFLLNTWFSISKEDIDKAATMTGRASVVESAKGKKLSQEELYSILGDNKVFTDIISGGVSSKDGSYVKSYMVTIDKNALASALTAILEKVAASSTPSAYKTADVLKELNAALESVTFEQILVDVGVVDGKIHSFEGGIRIVPPAASSTLALSSGTLKGLPTEVHIGAIVKYSQYGKKFDITAPTDSKPLMDIINSSLSSARQKGTDAMIKSNLSSLRAQAEVYYDSNNRSYAGLCTKDATTKDIIASLTKASGTAPYLHR